VIRVRICPGENNQNWDVHWALLTASQKLLDNRRHMYNLLILHGLMVSFLSYYEFIKVDAFVKSRNSSFFVIPAKAGIQYFQ